MNSTWTIEDDRFTNAHNPYRFTIAHNPCVHEDALASEKESLQTVCHNLITGSSIPQLKRFVMQAISEVPSDVIPALLPVVTIVKGRPRKNVSDEQDSDDKKRK